MLLTIALAVMLTKDPGTADLFKDKGDTYIRAGSRAGLKIGDAVAVLSGDAQVGTATVMEVFEGMSRVALDDAASKHPEAKKVRLGAAPAVAAAGATALKGHATIIGIGPAKQITLYNESDKLWTGCDLRLPDNRHYKLAELRANDQERIFLHMFRQDGVELDRPLDTLTVKCEQGMTAFLFDI